ncbi:hypothetical protein FQA39_LY19027 [Lamprigera yunnana]|nr:hypothetical protein FQA39_LY19027 [Lamprigera yunnana]
MLNCNPGVIRLIACECYQSDIICLQEVDQNIYNRDIKPNLSSMYWGLFHEKLPRTGLACFFTKTKFKLMEDNEIVFSEELPTNPLLADIWNFIGRCTALKDWILKQPTSLQVTVLKSTMRHEIVIIANTHLYHHAKADTVQLLQCSIALDYISDICKKYKRLTNSRVSIIFCGGFNTIPLSKVHEFIMKGLIQYTIKTDIKNSEKTICLRHPFKFGCAYGTPKYTKYTIDFKGCLDYIFYDSTSLNVIDCVPLPDESILAKCVALPNEVFPSDHLALTEKGGYCRNPAEKLLGTTFRSNYAVNSLIKSPSSANCELEFDIVTDILEIGEGVPLDAPESEKSSTSIRTETDTDTEETLDDCTAKY